MNVIEFQGFSKRSGEFSLENLNFAVPSGYITGLIGPNGSGKTTLIRSIMNLIRPDRGGVRVFGQTYADQERDIKRRIGFVYDEDFFYNHLSLTEMAKIIASFYPTWNEQTFKKTLDDFRLPPRRLIRDLSKGMKTKFALAAALAHEPELLIMDEPTSGLDPVFRREILTILSEYIQEGTRSVLFSTHISSDLERIADYIVYIRHGQVEFCGTKEELTDSYLLLKGPAEWLRTSGLNYTFLDVEHNELGFEGLIARSSYSEEAFGPQVRVEQPSLDDILVYTRRG
ncbi:ABC transporter ATP-binding protein [Paenibacillus sp. MMS20-IR301]|uniref:ABC transporter ATP-binding protein n=1 Tax=Paenibacillus sp. MMS20-IR301 TaxID=2895946 RepID=UPI0028E59DF9|nr:ABC transporter ATP-binding protein [Paenibacillus sp. MMS20-IR301]WNS44699.1 ABC transporter ATP-binding protein [Paenibacillus sp. MMS20-IR301]